MDDPLDVEKIKSNSICVRRSYSLENLLLELDGKAFDTLDTIIEAGAGDLFATELMETYGGDIDYYELVKILESGSEAFAICGLNPDGTKDVYAWGGDECPVDEAQDNVGEELQMVNGSADSFDRMVDGFPTIVYTVNEDNPDWEEKFDEIQNIVYSASNEVESYDIHLEGGLETPSDGQKIELVIDPTYGDDEDLDAREADKKVVNELIDTLVNVYGFEKIDFDTAEIESAVLPRGEINVYDGNIDVLRDELAHTHEFEEPREIREYLTDKGFNVVDTDGGNGFEAWYEDPDNGRAGYLKFLTNQCWDEIYGPCCRLNESTFKIIHPKKITRK